MLAKIRPHYWSCSKIADIIRGTKKAKALTSEEWGEWRKQASLKHPIRYWIAEECLDKLQNFFYFPSDVYKSIKFYCRNRFIDKTHCLKTGLKPGSFYELDQRILYGLFNELVEFVEIDIAVKQNWYSNKKKYKFTKGRCSEAGLDYLKWASRLKSNRRPTDQAVAAKTTLKLYNWWKCIRPNRPDPYAISGWDDYHSSNNEKDKKNALNKLGRIENKYQQEDEQMLIELIKIRSYLWA